MSCDNCNDKHVPDCNESKEPFCDQCAEDSTCIDKMDAACVIYHFNNPNKPSKLTCLKITNNTSIETILEAIDSFICNAFNIVFSGQDTETIHWTPGGPAGHDPSADVVLSNDEGQIIVERTNGLWAGSDGKVKVDVNDTPDFLENQIVGSTSPSGDITITVINDGGILKIVPSLNIDTLAPLICSMCNSSPSPSGGVDCDNIQEFGTFKLGVPSNGLLKIPITVIGSGQITVTASITNESFNGAITQTINEGTTVINLPIFYNGEGSDGSQFITVTFEGTQNVISCGVEVTVAASDSCTPVSIVGSPVLPDGRVGFAYNYTIGLNGTQPFALDSIIAPGWMSIVIDGGNIVFSGTPSGGDIGTDLPVSFNVSNCGGGDSVSFSQNINVDNTRVSSTMAGTTISGTYGGFTFGPMSPGGQTNGIHNGFTGSICVTVGGNPVIHPSNLTLLVNGSFVQCIAVNSAGVYCFASATYVVGDYIEIQANTGGC